MSDLIGRKEVIKLVNQFVFGLCKEQNDEVRRTFNKYIEKMPTAYDIDKVIAELKDAIQNGVIKLECGNEKLFEIVKQCGVSDDVCEWKLTDTKKVMPYKTSCGNEDLYDNSYKYCPYCGKKIKVVE